MANQIHFPSNSALVATQTLQVILPYQCVSVKQCTFVTLYFCIIIFVGMQYLDIMIGFPNSIILVSEYSRIWWFTGTQITLRNTSRKICCSETQCRESVVSSVGSLGWLFCCSHGNERGVYMNCPENNQAFPIDDWYPSLSRQTGYRY